MENLLYHLNASCSLVMERRYYKRPFSFSLWIMFFIYSFLVLYKIYYWSNLQFCHNLFYFITYSQSH
jgi:hypothetical protein